ncbi:amidohydrolase [Catenulispora acidiphila DSM 44928]|uniref:Amidohydrolase n=1 Tax=Catenulispora acidiphila (strain DSM 44928 / JCM 14897 / NBRC 102108 / NRRL B-24433 / ID139908) TaxID=479433 RepID=C7QBY1_CATAD|nr:amidohydrolase [Catenulispora acidiphila]ACU72600.1 amidohydrolase [Catenulispora acidiphila DSM 44928]
MRDLPKSLSGSFLTEPFSAAQAVELYLHLHRDPELSGAEERTAARLARALTGDGFEVASGVGGHGVVGVLRNGSGPTVMLRAELDALPVREQTALPYASTATALDAEGRLVPVMHACGHDLHVACAAGAATVLAQRRDRWRGTLMVVGQPAEETLTGAAAMLEDGLYERFAPGPPDAVLAQHSAPLPAGMTAHPTGAATAAGAALRVVVHGRGGHAATPHLAIDPVRVAAAIVLRLATVADEELGTAAPAAVSVGSLHAGTSPNVIPDEAHIEATIRTLTDPHLERLLAAVHRIIAAESEAAGCPEPPAVTLLSRTPANHPDPTLAAAIIRAHRHLLGTERVALWPPTLATEDFPLFGPPGAATGLHKSPATRTAYWMFGTIGPTQWHQTPGHTAAEKLATLAPNHSPKYQPDPGPAIPAGIRTLASAALAAGLAEP